MEKEFKSILKVWFIFVLISLPFMYIGLQLSWYRAWVQYSAIESYEACMVFERNRRGEEHCLTYAKDSNRYTPYPVWKALIFINPSGNR